MILENQKKFFDNCKNGNLEDIKSMYNHKDQVVENEIDINLYNNYGMNLACMNGHINIVIYIFDISDINNMSIFYSLGYACKHGHIDIIKYICEKFKCICGITHSQPFKLACDNNHPIVVKFIIEQFIEKYKNCVLKLNNIFRSMCEKGHIDIVKILLNYRSDIEICSDTNKALTLACKRGKFDVVKCIMDRDGKKNFNLNEAFLFSCMYGHLDIVKYLIETAKTYNKFVFDDGKKTYGKGKIGYIINEFPIKQGIIIACNNGQLDVFRHLEYLMKLNDGDYNDIFITVCAKGHIKILKYLINTIEKNKIPYEKGFESACQFSQIHIIKYLLNDNFDVNYHKYIHDGFIRSCLNGNLELIKLLFNIPDREHYTSKLGKIMIGHNIPKYTNMGFEQACKYGHINVIKYLLDKKDNNININTQNCINFVCTNKNLNILKFLVENPKYGFNINFNNYCAFRHACSNRHFKVTEYLLNIPNINIDICKSGSFTNACSSGKLDIIKYLLSIPNNNININEKNDLSFILACQRRHLNVVKFLLHLENNNIDVYTREHVALDYACRLHHYDIVEYLLDNCYDDTRPCSDDIFITACENKNIYLSSVLSEKFSRYNAEYHDKKLSSWSIQTK
jgi:uncharacterized protein